jgi:hypothetical protein
MTNHEGKKTPSRGDESAVLLPWEQQFIGRCRADQSANAVWRRLQDAGLGAASKRLLWEYAHGEEYFTEMQRGIGLIIRNVKAFRRAWREEQKHSSDPRAQMFRDRREAAFEVLARTAWPFRNPRAPTFGDLARIYRSDELFDLGRLRALVGRSKLSYMLAILRAGTRAHGVDLSADAVAVLATCADPKRVVDGRVLRRYFKETHVELAEDSYRSVFDDFLRASPLS